jgi:beta-mannosidase
MYIQSLSGQWRFRQSALPAASGPGARSHEWLPAQVPGSVHTDLMTAGRIPDPFVGDNEKRVQWVAESDWEYQRGFTAHPELLAEKRVFLVCDGLDTLAEVFLNGQSLGKTDNMFRQYGWEVRGLLRDGENELRIAFASPVAYCRARQAERPLPGVSQAIPGGPHLRKAPCQFGWDWGPQLPPIGIWKEIRLEAYSLARISDVHLRQEHAESRPGYGEAGRVVISAAVEVERWLDHAGPDETEDPGQRQEDPRLTVTLRVTSPDGTALEEHKNIPAQASAVTLEVPVTDPKLWWPNGYGAQPLYRVEVSLHRAEGPLVRLVERMSAAISDILGSSPDARPAPLDQRAYRVGLRTIELRQSPDQWGKSFAFIVNGVPIFAKGADWIPADSFPTRISDQLLDHLIRSAAETHQNMLRVWGGGFYEEERFYDLCDRYGILVWQDFIYSCSVYPMEKPEFVEDAHVEVVENIRRLRHRASLALWCGNNEMEWGWTSWGWDQPANQGLKAAYDLFFHHTLPGWCAAESPDTPYWPSSPSSGIPFEDPNSQVQGDAHYWEVWHGRKPFTAYRAQYPRFMSEFGFQSLPPLPTVRTYADVADWNMTSYIMEHHQRSASGNGLIIAQMTETFRMPKDFPSLVYLSMVLQAEGIRSGVEHWRRHPERVAGTLYWQLNDTWPVASWSSLDYFGRWKALHYAARRFFAPVMLSLEDNGTTIGLHVTSDLQAPWEGTIGWSLETLDGESLDTGEETVHAAPLTSTPVRLLDFAGQISDDNCRQVVFVCELRSPDAVPGRSPDAALGQQDNRPAARALATFAPNKHLELRDPGLAVAVRGDDTGLAFDVSARSLARFVELGLAGADVVFSDNYFDVPAGRTVTVTAPLPEGWTVEQASAAVQARSLYHSFA